MMIIIIIIIITIITQLSCATREYWRRRADVKGVTPFPVRES